MELTETLLSSEPIFNGRIVRLHVDTVRLPDGREAKREVMDHNGAVCIVPVRDDGMVLLVRQFRLPAGKVLLEAPAGTREKGEDPDVCAARELEEETGYTARYLRKMFSAYMAPGYSTELIHFYLATGLVETQSHTDEDENVELSLVPLKEAERMALAGELQDSKTISALLVAARLLEQDSW